MKKNWKHLWKRLAAGALAVCLFVPLLAGCGTGDDPADSQQPVSSGPAAAPDTTDPVTLKILFNGPKTDGWDEIYSKFLEETKDTLNTELDITFVEHADYKDKLNLEMTSGANYDLVFDAAWVHLRELAADGYYADLSGYFNNDAYPGLKKAFSENVMESNKWFGTMCYIPMFHSYGNGIPCIYYREDLAEAWGVGKIDSMDKLEQYWAKAKENGMIPLSARDTRGFFQLYTIAGSYSSTATRKNSAEAGVQFFNVGGNGFWAYIKDNQVAAIAMEGSGDENFKDFPEGYNYDFGVDRFEKFAEWQAAGYLSADSMTCKDSDTPFWAGQAASSIGNLDEYEKNANNIVTYTPDAKLGIFVYIDSLRNMEDHSYPTAFRSNNGLAVPASSKNIDRTMKFLDWMFSDAAHHDLFELGIEGKDWEAVGDDQYKDLSGYAAAFPGYGFTWNTTYVKFSDVFPDDVLAYRKWETKESSYIKQPVSGFSFDSSSSEMSTYTAQVKAIADMVATTKLHGILSDGTNTYSSMEEMLKASADACYAAGADKIQEELVKQINEYLAANS